MNSSQGITVSKKKNLQDHGHFQQIKNFLAPHILDITHVPLTKEGLIYQMLADKFHMLVVGSPSEGAKTQCGKGIEPIYDSYEFYSFTGDTTKKGLPNIIKSLRRGVLHLDEIGEAAGSAKDTLMGVMQDQELKEAKGSSSSTPGPNKKHPAEVNVYATANPQNGQNGGEDSWVEYGKRHLMKEQMPLSNAVHRRFHATICVRPYTQDEFDKVNRYYDEDKKQIPRSDARQINNLILDMRQIDVDVQVPEYVFGWFSDLKKIEEQVIVPITNEQFKGAREIAKANARLRYTPDDDRERGDELPTMKTTKRDWKRTMMFLSRCIFSCGVGRRDIKRQLGV